MEYKTELTTKNVTTVIDFLLKNAVVSDECGIAIFQLFVLGDSEMNLAVTICKEINDARDDVAIIADTWYDDYGVIAKTWFLYIY